MNFLILALIMTVDPSVKSLSITTDRYSGYKQFDIIHCSINCDAGDWLIPRSHYKIEMQVWASDGTSLGSYLVDEGNPSFGEFDFIKSYWPGNVLFLPGVKYGYSLTVTTYKGIFSVIPTDIKCVVTPVWTL